MKAVLEDELRIASVQRAYRYGFMSVLLAQPVLAVLLQFTEQNNVWIMSSMSLTLGLRLHRHHTHIGSLVDDLPIFLNQ
jgi:hypothetical protein